MTKYNKEYWEIGPVLKPTVFELLREFHETYGAAIDLPFEDKLLGLREKLLQEELSEVIEESIALPIDRKKLTKELADLMYVTIGFATTFGLPLEEVFYAVHESNMSKLGPNGEVLRREDGKILKGSNYKEPDLDQFFKD